MIDLVIYLATDGMDPQSPDLNIIESVWNYMITLSFASSNVTSHLFYPSTDYSRLVLRALEPVLSRQQRKPRS